MAASIAEAGGIRRGQVQRPHLFHPTFLRFADPGYAGSCTRFFGGGVVQRHDVGQSDKMNRILNFVRRITGAPQAIDGVAIIAVGNDRAVCPSCDNALAKFPGRKIACPHCGQPIFSRTRPVDGRKVLLSAAQASLLEEQWAAKNGTLQELRGNRRRFETIRSQLRVKFGRDPSENDVRWQILNEDALTYSSTGDIGLYRNVQFEMSDLLWREGKKQQSLHFLLAVCYLDVNGPQNTSGWSDFERVWFSTDRAFLAPGVLSRVGRLIDELRLNEQAVYEKFVAAAKNYAVWPHIALQPDDAWPSIWKEIRPEAV